MVKRKKSSRRKKTVRKQSSSAMSTLASKTLKKLEDLVTGHVIYDDKIRVVDVKKLCASVLSQDETKGQRR